MHSVTQRYRLQAILVLVFAAVLFFARLGSRSLWSEEVRWAEIPRQMERSGDYFQPTFNGRTYYDKPLGSYWLVVAARSIPGVSEEVAARLPCALAGLLGVWFTMGITRRLFGPATAPLAGLILATSFSFVFFARHASADVETVAGVLGALWLFLACENQPDGWWVVLFWSIMALTSLSKGLLGFALPLVVIGAYRLTVTLPARLEGHGCRKWLRWIVSRQDWLLHRKTLLALPLAAAIYLAPFLCSLLRSGSHEGLAMVFRENIRRFFDPVNHRGPVYLYAGVIFELLAPWSILLPAALWQCHRSRSADGTAARGERFALAFFWSIFVFFTLSASRRSYYLLPILPAAAILIAHLLLTTREKLQPITRWFLLGCHPRTVAVSLGSIATVSMTGIFLVALPAFESTRTRKPFAQDVVRVAGSDLGRLALFRERDVAFYLSSQNVAEFSDENALLDAVNRGQFRWVIARRSDLAVLEASLIPVLSEAAQPWESESQRRAKLVLLKVPLRQTTP